MIPRVYAAITAVAGVLARHGIAKDRLNLEGDYAYRSVDDVLNRLAPLLCEHRLCVLPRVLDREVSEREDATGELLVGVAVKVAYQIVSAEDGSSHTVEAYGEALDGSDKATAKAMQSAYKYAMIQAFCIPVSGSEDADALSPRIKRRSPVSEPVQGWGQWCADIEEMLRVCESCQAVRRVQDSNRGLLAALQRERPELYAQVGQAIVGRREALQQRSGTQAPSAEAGPAMVTTSKGAAGLLEPEQLPIANTGGCRSRAAEGAGQSAPKPRARRGSVPRQKVTSDA